VDVDETHGGYGAVLDPDWPSAIVRTEHPVDGSAIYSTAAATDADGRGPVLLLHGVGNDGSVFGPVMPQLSHLGPVIAPRLTPHLLTDVGHDRAEMSTKLVDWLAEITPPPWRLVGHSMGGVMIGLILRTRPELVERVVLLNAPLPGVVHRIRVRDTLDRTGRALLFMKTLAAVTQFGRPRLPRFLRGTEVAAVRLALRGFVHDPGALDGRVLSRAVLGSRTTDGNDFLELAAGLPAWESEPFDSVPVSIVLGDSDPLIPTGDVDRIVDAYPSAPIHVFADSGHFVHLEWSQMTVDVIVQSFADAAS
jgi:pimeloyl-ACP methyl ester carboxylesterase